MLNNSTRLDQQCHHEQASSSSAEEARYSVVASGLEKQNQIKRKPIKHQKNTQLRKYCVSIRLPHPNHPSYLSWIRTLQYIPARVYSPNFHYCSPRRSWEDQPILRPCIYYSLLYYWHHHDLSAFPWHLSIHTPTLYSLEYYLNRLLHKSVRCRLLSILNEYIISQEMHKGGWKRR